MDWIPQGQFMNCPYSEDWPFCDFPRYHLPPFWVNFSVLWRPPAKWSPWGFPGKC